MRLIDADALWNKLHERICKIDNGRAYRKESMPVVDGMRISELEFCIELIQCEPTIAAEPVRYGRWIRSQNGLYACNVCGVNDLFGLSSYCQNCSAKMYGGGNEEKDES